MELEFTGPVYEGENDARAVSFTVDAPYREYELRLAFFTPMHRRLLSPVLTLTGGAGTYALPACLLDAPGLLEIQLIAESGTGEVIKSRVLKLPVERSVPTEDAAAAESGLVTLGALDTAVSGLTQTAQRLSSALAGKQDALTFDAVPRSGSSNPVKSGGVYNKLTEINSVLQFDDAPTSGSNKLLKSKAVYNATAGVQGTFNKKNQLWDVKKSRIRQIGSIVFVSLWLERALALGTEALDIGTVSGVAAPAGLTVVSCATVSENTLASIHPATATILSDGGAAKITVRPTQASDTMVFINSFYFTGN